MKIRKLEQFDRQPLPKAVVEYMKKQTAILDAETEMRSPEYHSNYAAIRQHRQRVEIAYQEAAKIDVTELLNAPAGVRFEFDLIMTTFRKVSAILDQPDLYHDEASQNRALSAVTAFLVNYPADRPERPLAPSWAHWRGAAVRPSNKTPTKNETDKTTGRKCPLYVRFADRDFVHLKNGNVLGTGYFTYAANNDNIEAMYKRAGETEPRQVVLNVAHLHYDGETDSGFCFGDVRHEHSEIPELKSRREKEDKD